MGNNKLEFNFKDYSSYEELPGKLNGEETCFQDGSPEYLAFKNTVTEKIKLTKLLANVTDTGYNDRDKLKLIEFDTFNHDDLFETKGLVGVVQVNNVLVSYQEGEEIKSSAFDVKITISSRFDGERPYFLSYMLSYENPNFLDDYKVESGEESLFAILLLYIFKKQLIEADKQGMFKTYQRLQRNDDKVKGAIDIARHIKSNMIFNGRISYNCKENTIDNTINHLILHAYYNLKKRYPNETRLHLDKDKQVGTIINRLKEFAPSFYKSNVSSVIKKCITPLSHPYYHRYRVLQETCMKILRNIGVSVFDGNSDLVTGVLFYIPDLWEKFLLHSYKKYFSEENFCVEASKEFKIFKGKDATDYRKKIRPDFIFARKDKKETPFFVLDAKFKPKWYDVSKGETLNKVYDDYLQVINYMVSCNTKSAGVIFPTNEGKLDICKFDISEYNDKNKFYCCCLFVPKDEEKYIDWVKKLEDNIDSTFNDLLRELNRPCKVNKYLLKRG